MYGGAVMPLILGRPFLNPIGAVSNMTNKRMCFHKVDKKKLFDSIHGPSLQASANQGNRVERVGSVFSSPS